MLKQKTGRPESFSVFKIVPGFWPEIQAFKALIAGSFAVLVLEICFRLPEPWPLKYVFDSIFSAACQTGGDELLPLVTGPTLEGLIFVAAATFVLFSFLRAISAFESSAGFVLAENRVMTKTRNDLYRYMQPLPLSFHTKSRNGDLLTRLICDMGLLQEVTVTGLLP
ncbi:MAG: ABC transporter transmembrane domain-containing protein, partial [Nitrospinota bacterium]